MQLVAVDIGGTHARFAIATLADDGTGRELFAMFRHLADEAEKGGSAMLASTGL